MNFQGKNLERQSRFQFILKHIGKQRRPSPRGLSHGPSLKEQQVMTRYLRIKLMVVLVFGLSSCDSPTTQRIKEQRSHRHHGKSHVIFPELNNQGLCQSPINIRSTKSVEGHHDVHLGYHKSKQKVVNKGHTIELDYDPGSTIEVDGKVYEFIQLHFHTPSEHLIDGVTYPMEVHMVHTLKGDPGKYLVIGILFKEGEPHPFLTELLKNVPDKEGQHILSKKKLNVADLLKSKKSGYFTYQGSLTTPPYTETVSWAILKDIHTASPEQIELIHSREGNNARLVQALSGRTVERQ